MTLQRRLWINGLVVALALGVPAAFRPNPVGAQTPTPATVDVRLLANEIDAWRLRQHEQLRDTPNDTRENHRRIDEEARVRGRQAEPVREDALQKLFEKAGLKQPRYTGTGPTEAGSGGVLGDQDLASLSAQDYAKVMRAAKDLNYTVTAKGDSMTIEELQVTTHRAAAERFGPTGSSASETGATGRASNKETAVSFGIDPDTGLPVTRDAHLKTLDNLKKSGELLAKDPAGFTLKDWADWAKMVGRNMDAAGIQDAQLRATLEELKIRNTPESAGVTPDRATPAERAKALKDFVTRANEVNRTAYARTREQSAAIEAKLRRQIDAAADASARSEAKAKLIDYLNEQRAARESVVRNQRQGGELLNNLDGVPPNERPLTPSQADEAAVKSGRTKLVEAVKAPVEPQGVVAGPSRVTQYGGPLVLVYGAVAGALEGAKQAREEAKPDEWFVTTAAKGIGYGVLHTLGIPEAFRVGTEAGNESMRQYQADLAAGKDPSLAWAKLRGVGTGLGRFVKGMAIDPAVMLAESGGGLGGDAWRAYRAELDHLAAEQVQSEQAVGIARNLARDLAAAVKTADAEIKVLRPFTTRVEEARRLTNELRTKRDTLQTALDTYCRRAGAGSAATPAANAPAPDTKLSAELVDIAKQSTLVCRAADQAVSAFRQQRINAQGVSFRLENVLRRPQQDVERRLDAARRGVDALAGTASGDAALLQVAERAYQETAALAQQATGLAASIDATAALLQQRVTNLRTTATNVTDMRQRFVGGVKRFYGVNPDQDAELRGLLQDVSPLKIDAAAVAELEAAARSFTALSALLTNDIAKRVPPPCPALVALADRWAAIWQQHGDLKTVLDDAAAHVSAGRMCLDRLSALVPPTPTPTPPPNPPPAKPVPGTEPAVRDQKPRIETTKSTCEEGVQATVKQGREAHAKWEAVGRERTPWVFVCGNWSRYTPCLPSNFAWVWKEVDGKVPQDQWGHSLPAACAAAYLGPSVYDFQQCVWKEYLAKLDAWAAKKTAECPKTGSGSVVPTDPEAICACYTEWFSTKYATDMQKWCEARPAMGAEDKCVQLIYTVTKPFTWTPARGGCLGNFVLRKQNRAVRTYDETLKKGDLYWEETVVRTDVGPFLSDALKACKKIKSTADGVIVKPGPGGGKQP